MFGRSDVFCRYRRFGWELFGGRVVSIFELGSNEESYGDYRRLATIQEACVDKTTVTGPELYCHVKG